MKYLYPIFATLLLVGMFLSMWSPSADASDGGTINGSVSYALLDVIEAATPGTGYSPACVKLSGNVMGRTYVVSRRVEFNVRRVCQPITQYLRDGVLYNTTEAALTTIGHEAAHLRGVESERKAECLGVRFAYAWLKRHGAFRTYVASGTRSALLYGFEEFRPLEYKLRGTCTIPA